MSLSEEASGKLWIFTFRYHGDYTTSPRDYCDMVTGEVSNLERSIDKLTTALWSMTGLSMSQPTTPSVENFIFANGNGNNHKNTCSDFNMSYSNVAHKKNTQIIPRFLAFNLLR